MPDALGLRSENGLDNRFLPHFGGCESEAYSLHALRFYPIKLLQPPLPIEIYEKIFGLLYMKRMMHIRNR